jgi:hypothetical protein
MSEPIQVDFPSRPKILFLRSSTQVTFAAFIAGGLQYAGYDFMQYPALPSSSLEKLNKLYDPEEAQEHLEQNVIQTRKELQKKIEQNFFDLILLVDYDASLFRFSQMSWFKKTRNLLGLIPFLFKKNSAKRLNCLRGVPFSLSTMNKKTPLAVIDLDDWICLPVLGQNLLQECSFYYKRELPLNRFFLYYQQRPAPWRLWRNKLAPVCKKVKNIPLGIEDKKYFSLKKLRTDNQDIDIFYCGTATSTIRIAVVEYLQKISQLTNWNIIVADALPFIEYCKTVARSKITLSISGGGWDCFRHYEAIALGSLPVMDQPTVDTFWWNKAPKDVFFSGTFEDFYLKLDQLLKESVVRNTYFKQIEDLIESYMLHSKIVQYIVDSSLSKKNTAY